MPLRFRILPASPAGRAARMTAVAAAGLAEGPADERAFEVDTSLRELRVGRQRGVELELPFPAVSSLHARLSRGEHEGDWQIEDLGSMNGTWLDGQRLSPGQPLFLRAGQRLRVATVDMVFEGWSASLQAPPGTVTIARRLISDLFGATGDGVPTLTVEFGFTRQTAVRLAERQRRYLVGRSPSCDLVLSSDHASREHAAFVRQDDGVWVSDLGSKNGVQVNGLGIAGTRRLSDGDRVSVGEVTLRFTDPEDRYLRRIEALEGQIFADAGVADSDSGAKERRGGEGASRGRIPTPRLLPAADAPGVGPSVSSEAADVSAAAVAAVAEGKAQAQDGDVASAIMAEDTRTSRGAGATAATSRLSFRWLGTSLVLAVVLAAVAGLAVLWLSTR